MYLQQIMGTLTSTQGCQHSICRPSPPHCFSPPTRNAGIICHCQRNLGRCGGTYQVCWTNCSFFVILTISRLLQPSLLTPSSLVAIANSTTMPMTDEPWLGLSTTSNSTDPQQLTIPQQPAITLISPSIHAHDLEMLRPQQPHWLWQAPHSQSCTVSMPHQQLCSMSPMSTSRQARHHCGTHGVCFSYI